MFVALSREIKNKALIESLHLDLLMDNGVNGCLLLSKKLVYKFIVPLKMNP
jgi:hypothetical protein